MHSLLPIWSIVLFFIYILIIAFTIWLGYRFVRAQESMAESLREIEKQLSKDNKL